MLKLLFSLTRFEKIIIHVGTGNYVESMELVNIHYLNIYMYCILYLLKFVYTEYTVCNIYNMVQNSLTQRFKRDYV